MDFWNKARSFAEEAAKRSSELAMGPAKLGDIVTDAMKRSKEIAAEASKRAEEIKVEAAKQAELIKSSLAEGVVPPENPEILVEPEKELERFGITEELRDFVKGITMRTFQEFPLPDDSPMSDVPTVSNVRQDLKEWQEKHAKLVF
ncbi:putative phosphatidylinositol 4-kinase type 2-beta [Hibiscus syriacus]|uniref:Phosphatidylinositol 4-kinase type 2-beta n=1 Tax=Hibiscus syriacus TaxID=106335 RepID=A0A6A2Y6G7_HIBSY|nr:putative phosphatidylinositol 4-kinase type 2-beta [Hibiscus syriacus]